MTINAQDHRRRWRPWFREFHKEDITFVIVVENVGIWAFAMLCSFLLLAVVVNRSVVNLEDNLIISRYGVNSICVYIDAPPFSYVAALLYVPVSSMLNLFAMAKFARAYMNYKDKGHRMTKCDLIFFAIACKLECAGNIVFTQSLATQPEQSEVGHILPYLLWVVGRLISVLSTGIYYHKGAHPDTPEWVMRFTKFVNVFFCVSFVMFAMLVFNAFGRLGGAIWDIEGPFAMIYGKMVSNVMFMTMGLTMVLFFAAAPYVEDIRLTFTRDLSDMETSPLAKIHPHSGQELPNSAVGSEKAALKGDTSGVVATEEAEDTKERAAGEAAALEWQHQVVGFTPEAQKLPSSP